MSKFKTAFQFFLEMLPKTKSWSFWLAGNNKTFKKSFQSTWHVFQCSRIYSGIFLTLLVSPESLRVEFRVLSKFRPTREISNQKGSLSGFLSSISVSKNSKRSTGSSWRYHWQKSQTISLVKSDRTENLKCLNLTVQAIFKQLLNHQIVHSILEYLEKSRHSYKYLK